MISSDLLDSTKESDIEYFIIGGFCIISSIFSNNFIDSLGKKVLNQLDNIKEEVDFVKKEVDEATTENDHDSAFINSSVFDFELTEKDQAVLEAMIKSKFIYRSAYGISKEVKLVQSDVKNSLINLSEKNLINEIKRDNRIKWKLTNDGVYYYNMKLRT